MKYHSPIQFIPKPNPCPHTRTQRMGFGIFCLDCKVRVGMVEKKEAEKLIEDGLLDDLKGMGF